MTELRNYMVLGMKRAQEIVRNESYYVRYDHHDYVKCTKEHSISNIQLDHSNSPAFFLLRSPVHECLRTTVIRFEDEKSFPNTGTYVRVFGKGGAKRSSPEACV